MRRTFFAAIAAALLAACGAIPPNSASGNHVTTQHGSARFPDALKGAADYCATRGMGIKHVRTDSNNIRPISTFECVEK